MGSRLTEADVRLFTTLVRFDAVYHGHFKCNRHKLSEMPALAGYARDLFQTPGFGETVDFEQIKQHYYVVHRDINPTGIVPRGPDAGLVADRARTGVPRPGVEMFPDNLAASSVSATMGTRPGGAHAVGIKAAARDWGISPCGSCNSA